MKKELDILIIEDVVHDAELIEQELRNGGVAFRSRRIQNREALLQQLRRGCPDVVLSDFTLPEFDALQALHLLRELGPDVPFILVTGTRSEEVGVGRIHARAEES